MCAPGFEGLVVDPCIKEVAMLGLVEEGSVLICEESMYAPGVEGLVADPCAADIAVLGEFRDSAARAVSRSKFFCIFLYSRARRRSAFSLSCLSDSSSRSAKVHSVKSATERNFSEMIAYRSRWRDNFHRSDICYHTPRLLLSPPNRKGKPFSASVLGSLVRAVAYLDRGFLERPTGLDRV